MWSDSENDLPVCLLYWIIYESVHTLFGKEVGRIVRILRDRVAALSAGLLAALGLAGFFLVVSIQPVYRSGVVLTLQQPGYLIHRVVPGGPADRAGLRAGDRIVRIAGESAAALYDLSRRDSREYLRRVSGLFSRPGAIEVATADGEQLTIPFQDDGGLRVRIASMHRTVLSNFVIAFLLIGIVTFFAAGVPRSELVTRYIAVSLAAAVTLPLSFFHSLWQFPLLFAVFLGLEVMATATGFLLIGFALRFPDPLPGAGRVLAVFLVPPAIRAISLIVAPGSLFGTGHFYTHIYLAVSIVIFAVLLSVQYRRSTTGSRRRIRWVVLGASVSVTPYLLYLIARLVIGSFIEYQYAGTLNQIAGSFFLVFPVTVGLGVVGFDQLDVDRLIANTVAAAVSAVLLGATVTVIGALTRETAPFMELVLLVIVVFVFSQPVGHVVHRWATGWFLRADRARAAAFERFRLTLLSCRRSDEVFTRMLDFVDRQFGPRWLAVLRETDDGVECLRTRRAEETTVLEWRADLPWRSLPVAPVVATTATGELTVIIGGPNPECRFLVACAPRSNGDPYVMRDIEMIEEASFALEQALLATSFAEDLLERIEAQRELLQEKNVLIREVHHRVKNNLQILLSIVRIHGGSQNSEVREVLARQERRIYSMALAHEEAYRHDSPSAIEMPAYVSGLVRSVATADQSPRVAVAVDVAELRLPVDIVLPAGLMMTEILDLVIEHAVDEAGAPQCSVRVTADPPTELTVEVVGNGTVDWDQVGEAASRDIVAAIAGQLGGSVAWNSGVRGGIRARLSLGDSDYSPADSPSVTGRR